MRLRARGYTIVELMMALGILAIGVSGIVAMHKVTVAANQHAKNLAIASHVAQAWQEQLAADAARWNHPSARQAKSDLGETIWLKDVGPDPRWKQPKYDDAVDFGPAFDALGNVVPAGSEPDAHFCTHVRFSWLYPDSGPTAVGNGLIRAEVRVFWLREGESTVDGRPVCDTGTPPDGVGAHPEKYHFVYKTSAIRQNTAS